MIRFNGNSVFWNRFQRKNKIDEEEEDSCSLLFDDHRREEQVAAIGDVIMTTRAANLDWRVRGLRVLPMFLLPVLSRAFYSGLITFTGMCECPPMLLRLRTTVEVQTRTSPFYENTLITYDNTREGTCHWRADLTYITPKVSQGTSFAGGFYYGKIKFPPEYPFKPPGIRKNHHLDWPHNLLIVDGKDDGKQKLLT